MAEKKIVLDVVVESKNSIETLGKLRKDLADLTLQLEGADKGSDSFKRLTAEINKTEKALQQTEGAFGEASDRLKTLSGGPVERATASFGLLKEGILGLDFGKFKTGIKGATDAFGGLGKAIVATGIGALVLIVVQLIQNFDTLKESGGLVGKVFTAIGDTINSIKDAAIDLADSLGLIDKDAEKNAKAQEDRTKRFIKNEEDKLKTVEGNYNKEIALAKSLGQNTDELEIKSLKAQKAVVDAQIARVQAFQETTSLFDSVLGPLLDKLTKQQEEAAFNLEIKENEINTRRIESAKKVFEEKEKIRLKTEEQDKINAEKAAEAALKAEEKALDDLLKEANAEAEATERARIAGEKYTADLKAQEDERTENERKAAEERLAITQQLEEQKIALTQNGLSAVSSLVSLFGQKNEKAAKAAFNVNKAIGIAQATIDTYQSAVGAYKSQLTIPSPDAPVRAAVAAGIAVAAGLANVAKIAATKFQSSSAAPAGGGNAGGGLAAASLGSTPTNVEQQTPNSFALFGTAGTANNLGFTQPQPIQAYVVESDITQTQQNLNKIKSASEL